MFNVPLIVWVGYIAVAVAVFMLLMIFRDKREGTTFIIREEGEVVVPCTKDGLGDDDSYTGPTEVAIEQRRCKKCGKKIRNDRWFCSMACKRAYLKMKKIPKFKSAKEAARFWDKHSPLDYPRGVCGRERAS